MRDFRVQIRRERIVVGPAVRRSRAMALRRIQSRAIAGGGDHQHSSSGLALAQSGLAPARSQRWLRPVRASASRTRLRPDAPQAAGVLATRTRSMPPNSSSSATALAYCHSRRSPPPRRRPTILLNEAQSLLGERQGPSAAASVSSVDQMEGRLETFHQPVGARVGGQTVKLGSVDGYFC